MAHDPWESIVSGVKYQLTDVALAVLAALSQSAITSVKMCQSADHAIIQDTLVFH